jgi:hypothetical protein
MPRRKGLMSSQSTPRPDAALVGCGPCIQAPCAPVHDCDARGLEDAGLTQRTPEQARVMPVATRPTDDPQRHRPRHPHSGQTRRTRRTRRLRERRNVAALRTTSGQAPERDAAHIFPGLIVDNLEPGPHRASPDLTDTGKSQAPNSPGSASRSWTETSQRAGRVREGPKAQGPGNPTTGAAARPQVHAPAREACQTRRNALYRLYGPVVARTRTARPHRDGISPRIVTKTGILPLPAGQH